MSFHRMGSLLGAYSLVGLGLTSTIFLSQRYLPLPSRGGLQPNRPGHAYGRGNSHAQRGRRTPLEKRGCGSGSSSSGVTFRRSMNRALFASSFRLLKEYLKSQKMDVKDFPELPAKIDDRAQLTQAWKAMIVKMEPKVAPKFDHQKLVYLALKGMLGALKDPYCSVLEPREFRVFEEHMTGGNFSGIGVMIELESRP
jgi:hypothetical protein